MSVEQVQTEIKNASLVIDTRHQDDFRDGHIPNSWFIGLNGQFAPWAGALIEDLHQNIVIVAEAGKEEEAIMRLARVGYDNVVGYLDGGIEAWKASGKSVGRINSITSDDFARNGNGDAQVMDVRKPSEYEQGHLAEARNIPLDFFLEELKRVDVSKPYAVHCKSGYRSMIAASILQAKGMDNITDSIGGFDALKETSAKIVEPEMA